MKWQWGIPLLGLCLLAASSCSVPDIDDDSTGDLVRGPRQGAPSPQPSPEKGLGPKVERALDTIVGGTPGARKLSWLEMTPLLNKVLAAGFTFDPEACSHVIPDVMNPDLADGAHISGALLRSDDEQTQWVLAFDYGDVSRAATAAAKQRELVQGCEEFTFSDGGSTGEGFTWHNGTHFSGADDAYLTQVDFGFEDYWLPTASATAHRDGVLVAAMVMTYSEETGGATEATDILEAILDAMD